jgi:hypothetical protein
MGKENTKYSNMAIKMGVSLFIFAKLGSKLDAALKLKYPIFLATLSLMSIIANLYLLIKETNE